MTRTLILGATGGTGIRLVEQMLNKTPDGTTLRVITRSKERFNKLFPTPRDNLNRLEIIEASLLDMTDEDFTRAIEDCDVVVSCLGHNMTMKGIYGEPRSLVTDSVKRVHRSISNTIQPSQPVKFILMNTAGAAHPGGKDDDRTRFERIVVGCIRALLPPHRDNEGAAAYLWNDVGLNDPYVEWVTVRPDALIDTDNVSAYDTFEKPKAGLFEGHESSRSNVAHFMSNLISDKNTWEAWKFKMPYLCDSKYLEM